MKRKLMVAVVAAAIFVLASFSAALAAPPSAPGTPGTPNCHGQTVAFLTHAFESAGVVGLGNIAVSTNLTVQQIQDIVDQYCAAP